MVNDWLTTAPETAAGDTLIMVNKNSRMSAIPTPGYALSQKWGF